MDPESPAHTQAWPANAQSAVARRAGAAVGPGRVLADLVVAAGVGPLGAFIDIWGAERGQGWGDRGGAPHAPCHPHAPSGRVHTNAVQLPRVRDESQWALVSISPYELSRENEK